MTGNDRSAICEHCRWWDPYIPEHLEVGGMCRLTEALNDIAKDYPDTLAWAEADWPDSETQVSAVLRTLPTFGCNQFESKL